MAIYHRLRTKFTKQTLILLLIFSGAMTLRIWGISWGLPERSDLHPDEAFNLIRYVQAILHNISVVAAGQTPLTLQTLDPVFLNYPSFLMYLIAIMFSFLKKLTLINGAEYQLFLVGRYISATFGAATTIVVYKIVREMKGSSTGGAIAASFMAIMPLHVWDSHVAVTDVLMTFWVAMSLLASLRLVSKGQWREYLFAGTTLGLAVGSKYTAALSGISILTAAICSGRPLGHTFRGLVLAAGAALAACFVVAPYSLLRFPDTLAALAFEHKHTMGHHPGFSLPALGIQYHRYLYQLLAAWPFSLGLVLYGTVLLCLFGTLRQCNRYHFVLFSFLVVFFGITGHFTFTPLRYYLPILVVLVVLAGEFLGKGMVNTNKNMQRATYAIIAVTFIYTTIFSVETTRRFSSETRLAAQKWIDSNLSGNSKILSVGWKYYYLGMPEKDFAKKDIDMETNFCNDSFLKNYDYVQITSLMYNRYYRNGNIKMIDCYDKIRKSADYALVKRFASDFINKELYCKLDPMFEGYFVSPTIEIYQKM